MTRKRLGDLLREEANKTVAQTEPPVAKEAVKPSRSRRKPASNSQTKMTTAEPLSQPPAPTNPATSDLETLTQVQTALEVALRNEQSLRAELTNQQQQEQDLQRQLEMAHQTETSLRDSLAKIKSQLEAQQDLATRLQEALEQSRKLETELQEAKKLILQLSAPQPQVQEKPAVVPTPAAPELAVYPQRGIAPIPQETNSHQSQPYRFERFGWVPLANHLLQPEPHQAKLSDADLGWVD